jgi:lipopolysaccharide/colanic/teichoic acid biosynthesis glycosyltransferase
MVKRLFDVVFSILALIVFGGVIAVFYLLVKATSAGNGFFVQERIGRYGVPFSIYKLRSMSRSGLHSVTPLGRFMRRYKVDELPQFFNILKGDMSFVGPRPDVPGYYDTLSGEAVCLLQLRPGLTGPASIRYANEEQLLAASKDAVYLNDKVIFPDKVRLNLIYYRKQSLWLDVKLLVCTLLHKLPKEFQD